MKTWQYPKRFGGSSRTFPKTTALESGSEPLRRTVERQRYEQGGGGQRHLKHRTGGNWRRFFCWVFFLMLFALFCLFCFFYPFFVVVLSFFICLLFSICFLLPFSFLPSAFCFLLFDFCFLLFAVSFPFLPWFDFCFLLFAFCSLLFDFCFVSSYFLFCLL